LGAGVHALSVGLGRDVWCAYLCFPDAPASALALPPQPVRAAVWQPALWIRAGLEPQMNADIAVEIRLYLNFCSKIKIITHNNRYLCSSVVNNKIELIPACLLSLMR